MIVYYGVLLTVCELLHNLEGCLIELYVVLLVSAPDVDVTEPLKRNQINSRILKYWFRGFFQPNIACMCVFVEVEKVWELLASYTLYCFQLSLGKVFSEYV